MSADQGAAAKHIAQMLEELRLQGWAAVTLIWHEETKRVTVVSNVNDRVAQVMERG